MYRYVIKRLLLLLLVIVGVSLLIFSIMSLAPGDLVLTILGEEFTQADYDAKYHELGLDQPLLVRYFKYMWGLLHGDLGYSQKYRMPVWDLYMQRLPSTLLLAFSATVVSVLFSIPL